MNAKLEKSKITQKGAPMTGAPFVCGVQPSLVVSRQRRLNLESVFVQELDE